MYIENLLSNISFFLLFCTMVFYWIQGIIFLNRNLFFFGNLGMLFSNLCLLSLLLLRWQNSGHFPLSNLYESLMFLSWGITAIHLLLEKTNEERKEKIKKDEYQNNQNELLKRKKKTYNQDLFLSLWLGCVTSPTALFINAFASFCLPEVMQKPSSLVPALQSNWLFMHVSVMIFSYASLIIGCLLSFVFLIITKGQDINFRYSLFLKNYSDSNLITNFLFNINNMKTTVFLSKKNLGKNVIKFRNNFLLFNNKKDLLKKKEDLKLKYNNNIFIEKWLKNLNLSLSSTLPLKLKSSLKYELFYFLIKSKTYFIDASPSFEELLKQSLKSKLAKTLALEADIPTHQNLSLSFCFDRPIINIENQNLFQKISSDYAYVKTDLGAQDHAAFGGALALEAAPQVASRMELGSASLLLGLRKKKFSKNKKNLTIRANSLFDFKQSLKSNEGALALGAHPAAEGGAKVKYKIAKNLDNLSYRILGIGFPFLTIGILSGSVWANEAWGSYWSWDPKETWALLTWLVFAVYFHSRLIKGWEGKKPAILATLGFIVVWICFIGVNLLKSGLHSYGFFS